LLQEYNLGENDWMKNPYSLRKKWAIVFHDSFMADMTSTQRSEGMNNVFKKRFRRELGLSELLVECEKVDASLRSNELDADFGSRRKSPSTYSLSLPMLKTAAKSYTKRMHSEFEAEFKDRFIFTGTLLQTEGSILTYMVSHMNSDHGAMVVFNTVDMTIKCSCRKYESIGMC
jgi:zinc finger SWIM domain-containing protein 3